MHHLPSFFRNLSAVPNRFKYRLNAPFSVLVFICFLCSSKSFQIPSELTIYYPMFTYFSLQFQYRFKQYQNARLRDLVFNNVPKLQIVLDRVRMPALETLFSKDSLKLQIVSNSVRIHALETFSTFSLNFKTVSVLECTLQRHCFQFFSLNFQIVSNSVRIHIFKMS